jgi:hypothetical protein
MKKTGAIKSAEIKKFIDHYIDIIRNGTPEAKQRLKDLLKEKQA